MKAFYEKAGVPTARYVIPQTLEEGLAFAEKVGYPVFVKPDGGMGAEDSYKLKNDEDMKRFFDNKIPNVDYIMEEFINGNIWSYDGISDSKGGIIFETCISWPKSIADIVNNQGHLFYYTANDLPEDLRRKGRATVKAFHVKSRFFHLEFFRLAEAKEGLGDVGDIVALEVNMRPAGGWTPDMYNYANSVDVYSIWADMVMYDRTYVDLTRRKYYAVYASRRSNKSYIYSAEQVREHFAGKIMLDEDIPESLSGAMGNHMWTARLDTEEEKDEFIAMVQTTAE